LLIFKPEYTMNTDVERNAHGDYELQSVEAVMAGTYALMSAYAHCTCNNNKGLMAHKIVWNLSQLSSCIGLSTEFRMALANVSNMWQTHIDAQSASTHSVAQENEARLWHGPSNTVQ
jgi:hypothetical protein